MKEKHNGGRAEAQGPQCGNLTGTLGHRGVHGVERAEDRADAHDAGHNAAQRGDDVVMLCDCLL